MACQRLRLWAAWGDNFKSSDIICTCSYDWRGVAPHQHKSGTKAVSMIRNDSYMIEPHITAVMIVPALCVGF
jgi:hypothetical protein